MYSYKRLILLAASMWLVASMVGCNFISAPIPTATPAPTPTPTPIPLDEWVEEGYTLLKESDFAGAEAAFQHVIATDEEYGPAFIGLSLVYLWQAGFEDEALTQAEKAVEVAPESAEAYAVLAMTHVECGDPEKAVEAAEQAVTLDETSAWAQAAAAQAYLADLRYDEARQAAERAIELDPELAEAYYALSNVYWETADFVRARAAIAEAIALEPEFAGWLTSLGYSWAEADRFDEATASFEQALEFAPDYVLALLGLANVSRARMNYEEAETQIKRAAELAPEAPRVYLDWGYLYVLQEMYDEALAKLNLALEKDEDYYYAQSAIGDTYLRQQECDMAARQFQDLLAAHPRYAYAQIGLGIARICAGNVNQALEAFRKAIGLEPYNEMAHAYLGYSYAIQGRWEDALEAYAQALRFAPAGAGVHADLGLVLSWQEEPDSAEAEYELALALNPYLVRARTSLGGLLLEQGKVAEAQAQAEQALALDEDNKEARLTLGAALVIQDRSEEAIEILEQLVEEESESDLARLYLGLAYRDAGEYSKAKRELETYLALCGEECSNQNQIKLLIEALDQGYTITEDKGISELEEILAEIEPEVSLEDAEGEGRTMVVSVDIPSGQEQQETFFLLGAIVGVSALTIPRIDPPVENGLLVRLEERGRPKFTVQASLPELRKYSAGISTAMEFVSSVEFSRLVTDETSSVREIQANVAEMRELAPEAAVPHNTMTQDDLQRYLADSIDAQTREAMESSEILLTLLGLIEPDLDLETLMVDLYTEQVAGFYDPDEESFYVLEDEEQSAVDQMTIAHEYVHALQDQHFGLDALKDESMDADRQRAFDALIEGDATLAMLLYANEYIGFFDRLHTLSTAGGVERDVFEASPAFIQEMELFPYVEGYNFVSTLYARGGWEAVNEAYENPPLSTEQILHPELYRQGDEPQEVPLPDLASELDWSEVESDVLGELRLRLTLAEYLGPVAASLAAEGWDGDHYTLLKQGSDGPYVVVIRTVWDDVQEVDEFWALYQVYMAHRTDYTEDVERLVGEVQEHLWLSQESAILASRNENGVTIVVGPDEETVSRVMEVLRSE